jgi:hypothetical protein
MARTKRRIDQFALMLKCRCRLQVARLLRRRQGNEGGARKTIFVHIGTHKTGTTSIQNFMRRQARQLKRSGILVPRSGTLGRNGGHHNIAWEIRGDPLLEPHAGGVDDLIIELKAARENVAVISSEDFEYLVQYPDRLEQFHARLVGAGYDPTYLVFFRNTVDYMRSLRSELKKQDIDRPLEWFEAEIKAKGSITVHGDWHYEFDYDRFVAKWKAAVGDAVLTFSYDEASRNPGLLPFFFETIGASSEIVAASGDTPLLNIRKAASAGTGPGA